MSFELMAAQYAAEQFGGGSGGGSAGGGIPSPLAGGGSSAESEASIIDEGYDGGFEFGSYGPVNFGSGSISTDGAATPETRQVQSMAVIVVLFVVALLFVPRRGKR